MSLQQQCRSQCKQRQYRSQCKPQQQQRHQRAARAHRPTNSEVASDSVGRRPSCKTQLYAHSSPALFSNSSLQHLLQLFPTTLFPSTSCQRFSTKLFHNSPLRILPVCTFNNRDHLSGPAHVTNTQILCKIDHWAMISDQHTPPQPTSKTRKNAAMVFGP